MVQTDCTETENDAQILGFLADVARVTKGEPLRFTDLQTPDLMRYAGHYCILRRDDATRDLTYILWGGELASVYGKDFTGKTISQADYGYATDIFANITHDVIDTQTPAYTSGTVDWNDRDHFKWWMVTLPLRSQKGDTANEAVCCIFWNI